MVRPGIHTISTETCSTVAFAAKLTFFLASIGYLFALRPRCLAFNGKLVELDYVALRKESAGVMAVLKFLQGYASRCYLSE
jgi:hypothetical protein